ncbi:MULTISPECIES: GDSL-type esterase/lipase family protein [unclassified Nocardia]|uniref:GDSL-type esterase/lipase family protein n=1 Tax=unclassified Nocardia TaxID=2637762 RepID=UPI001CE4168D|nr:MULTISPECIES: GDSL-type esterase/lipase family protein [unclassified Nocardia]
MVKRSILWTVVLVATVLGMPVAAAQPSIWSAAGSSGVYVALGESGAAGPFIPTQLKPFGCFRSDRNYAHLTAAALGLMLRDATCSGAKIINMYQPQEIPGGADTPQLDALTADASIVSVDIGINDYVSDSESSAAVTPVLDALLTDIHDRAPAAKVFVMGKLERIRAGGCFPQVPLPPAQADLVYNGVLAVNELARAAAAAHDAVFVDVYPASVGLDACAPEDIRWSEGLFPEQPAQPLHANARGHQHEAEMLEAAIRANT